MTAEIEGRLAYAPLQDLAPLKKLDPGVVLAPEQLWAMAEIAVQEMAREGESANTVASYASATRYWGAWYAARYGQHLRLPVPVSVVKQFIIDHLPRSKGGDGSVLVHELPPEIDHLLVAHGFKGKLGPLALNTVKHRLSVLSHAHGLIRHASNPCQDLAVRHLLRATTKAHAKRGDLAMKKAPLTLDPLNRLLATCDDSLIGKRDRALLLFAWASGGRRRSEVSSADMRWLSTNDEGVLIYELRVTKTNQSGHEVAKRFKPLRDEAGEALRTWLAAAQITEGRIFRRIMPNGKLGTPLQPAAVRTIVQARCRRAGLVGDFSAHSLRSGYITEGGRQGVPLAEIMALTSHESVPVVLGYMHLGNVASSKAAQMYRPPAGDPEGIGSDEDQ